MLQQSRNTILRRKNKKPILIDYFYTNTFKKKPLVIFCHGYKGFKDWGAWDLVANAFAEAGFFFVKFNFSHNGGSMEQPIDFPDMEAFGNNNYSKELDDLNAVLDYITAESFEYTSQVDTNHISLIGHSRGGGIAIIKASEDARITKLITWASVCDFGKRMVTIGDLETWKKDGVKYVMNGRTKQQMPHYYQFYEDFKANEARLNIELATRRIKIPQLILHGTADPAISFGEAKAIHSWNSKSTLIGIENANHVFGAKHPWEEEELSPDLGKVVYFAIDFIKK